MMYIIIEILDTECFNDAKYAIHTNSDGQIIEYNSIADAKQCAAEDCILNFDIYKKVQK